ncbi:MAG: hypothetical protein HY434_02880 [Candidatus Liptonbacteria bacterium]|nr:hypothetical protein [Candidatus Liptonbacteria bacterium]
MKTDRPWQVPLAYPNRGKCGLCNKDDESKHIPGPGWKSFQNAFTPYPYHRILVPDTCWENEKLRSLGGADTIRTALGYALAEVKRTRIEPFPIWIFTHVGYGSGQNFPHHHWHILEPATEPESFLTADDFNQMEATTISESEHFSAALWGIKAGQTFIVPKYDTSKSMGASSLFGDAELLRELAEEMGAIVDLFNQKFNSPDYCLHLDLSHEYDWFAVYTPILNNWGGTEFIAPYRGTPYTLPWPHKITAAYLRGEP